MKKAVLKCLFLTLILVSAMATHAQNNCLAGWRFTRPVSVENFLFGLMNDWQVRLEMDTQTLIASGKMNPDGSDIRFTTDDCCTQIPYWIQSGINTPVTVIWLRVPQLASFDTTWCNVYYGNPNATVPASNLDLVHFSIGNDSMGTDTALPGITVATQAYRFPFDAATVRFRVYHEDSMRVRFKTTNDTNMVTYTSPFFTAPNNTSGFENYDVEMLASAGGHFGWYASIGGKFMSQCTPSLPCPGSCGDAVYRPLDWGVFGAIKTDTCGFLPSMKVWYRRSSAADPYADSNWPEFDRLPGFHTSAPQGTEMCFTDSLPVTVAQVGALGYQWYRNGIPIVGANDTLYIAPSNGAYHCVANFGTSCRMIGSDTVTISYFSPEVNLGPNLSVCSDTGTTIHAGLGFFGYTWTGGSTLESLHIDSSGTYSVIVADSLGCLDTDSITVSLHPLPVPVITPGGPTVVCQGAFVQLNGYDPRWFAYQWLPDGQTSANVSVTTGGPYRLIIWDEFFCSDTSDTQPVVVYSTPVIELGPPTDICDGDSVVLDAGPGWQQIIWPDMSGGQTFTVGTTGYFAVEITDTNGCINSDTADVIVHFPAIVNIGPSDTICQTGTFMLDAGPGFVDYDWSAGFTTQTVQAPPGVHAVVVTDSFGCLASSNVVYVFAYPSLETPTVTGNASLLTASASPNYQWFFNGSLIAGATGQTIVPAESGFYRVEVMDPYNCLNAASVAIEVVLEIKPEDIPQGFSPNADGINDRFEIRRILDFPQSSLIVMNRWGQKVFEEAPYTNSFNGVGAGGTDLPDGTYFYILETGDGKNFQDYLIINR